MLRYLFAIMVNNFTDKARKIRNLIGEILFL